MNNLVLTTLVAAGFGLTTILFLLLYTNELEHKSELSKDFDGLSNDYAILVQDYNHMLKKVPRRGAKGRFAKKA